MTFVEILFLIKDQDEARLFQNNYVFSGRNVL